MEGRKSPRTLDEAMTSLAPGPGKFPAAREIPGDPEVCSSQTQTLENNTQNHLLLGKVRAGFQYSEKFIWGLKSLAPGCPVGVGNWYFLPFRSI